MGKPPTFLRAQLHDKTKAGVLNNFPFVDKVTDHVDCNVAVTSLCVELLTGVQLTSHETRVLGHDMQGGSGTSMTARVFESQGMVEGTDWVRFHNQDMQVLRDLLRKGWFAGVYIDNVVMNDNLGGAYSGAKTYDGAHAIGLAGWGRTKAFDGTWKRVTTDYDPTFDGRLPKHPFGPTKAPFWVIRQAIEHYTARHGGGVGLVTGYAVRFPNV